MAGCCLAVGFGILLGAPSRSAPRPRSRWLGPASGVLLIGLVLLERWPRAAVVTQAVHVPAVYAAFAHDPDFYAVMPLPLTYFHQQVYMFWQTFTGGPSRRGRSPVARATAADGWRPMKRRPTRNGARCSKARRFATSSCTARPARPARARRVRFSPTGLATACGPGVAVNPLSALRLLRPVGRTPP